MKNKYFADRFIPPNKVKNNQEYLQAKRLVNTSFISGLFSLLLLVCFLIINFKNGFYFLPFASLVFFILPFLLKYRISLTNLSNIYIGFGFAVVFFLTAYSGGVFSPIMFWQVMIPILALFILNMRSSITWSLFVLFGLLFLSYLEIFNITPENGISEQWLFATSIVAIATLMFILLFTAILFEANKTKALHIFYKKNKDLLRTLGKLQNTKKGLTQSIKKVKQQNDQLILQQKEIRNQTEKLKYLNDEKDYIMEIIAHDLKEPLNSINGLLQIILNDKNQLSTSQKDCLDHIKKSTKKSKNLIKKILYSGQVDHAQIHVRWEKTDLLNLLQSCLSGFNNIADQKKIHIEVKIEGNNMNTLTDKVLLTQTISNIVSNSIKFSPKESTVSVIVNRLDQNIKFEFKDQGPGIHEDEIDNLFERYSLLSAKPTDGESSTGLGLSIVKRYVELLEGQVLVENNKHRGANFILLIPIKS